MGGDKIKKIDEHLLIFEENAQMQQVELPIVYPPKTSHQFYALPLSIIMTNSDMWARYYSQFMQLHTFRDDGENIMLRLYNRGGNYEYSPLEQIKAEDGGIKVDSDIIALFKMMLRNGYYVYVFCDVSRISAWGMPSRMCMMF